MLPQLGGWSDQSTKIMGLLLSFTSLASVITLLSRMIGTGRTTIVLWSLLAIPFALLHLRQGYADIHWSLFALLSAITLDAAWSMRDKRLLTLSALMITAAAWTKLEGIYFALIPWMIACAFETYRHRALLFARAPMAWALVLGVLWPVRTLLAGGIVSPHKTTFEWHPEALKPLWSALFTQGTFGMHWWIICSLLIVGCLRHEHRTMLKQHASMIVALASTALLIASYLCTNEVRGLLQGDNFSRAMLAPTILLTYTLSRFVFDRTKTAS